MTIKKLFIIHVRFRKLRDKQSISADDNDHKEVSCKVTTSRKVEDHKPREGMVPVPRYLESSKKRKRKSGAN